jgi:hypothetical protein
MRRLVSLAMIAGCAGSPTPPAVEGLASTEDSAGHAWGLARDIAAPVVPAPLTAPHVATIRAIAVTDDGRAAVSVDRASSIRLWPALDGTREPIVIAGPSPAQLAIEHDGDGFSLALSDEVGQLAVIRLDARGVPVARVHVDLARPIAALTATGRDFVALCDDSTIAVVDAHGALVRTLVAPSGHRIASIAARHGAVLAIDVSSDGVIGRWIADDGWGGVTARLEIDPDRDVALAPDHLSVAAVNPRGCAGCGQIVRIELATGKVIDQPETPEPVSGVSPVGFLDANTIAVDSDGIALWRYHDISAGRGETVGAVGDGRVVLGFLSTLKVLTADGSWRYLGYRIAAARHVLATPDGWLASDGSYVARLDDHLRLRATVPLPGSFHDATLLDAHHALVRPAQAPSRVRLVDLDHPGGGTPLAVLDGLDQELFGYEPSTGLVAVGGMGRIAFARYDAAAAQLGRLVELGHRGMGGQSVRLLDPALSGGRLAVVLERDNHDAFLTVTEITGIDFDDPREPFSVNPVVQYELNDTLDITARAGLDPGVRRASPDGKLIAELAAKRMSLRTDRGELIWEVGVVGATDLAWSSRGELVVAGDGASHVELATGQLVDPTCGWQFGLWDEPPPERQSGTLCQDAD